MSSKSNNNGSENEAEAAEPKVTQKITVKFSDSSKKATKTENVVFRGKTAKYAEIVRSKHIAEEDQNIAGSHGA